MTREELLWVSRADALLKMAFALVVGLEAAGQRSTVIVRRAEIQDVLVNPGMGITTFQRSNGQALNPGLEWSEEGPTTKLPQAFPKPTFRTRPSLTAGGSGTLSSPNRGSIIGRSLILLCPGCVAAQSCVTGWVPGYWFERAWEVNYILGQALR